MSIASKKAEGPVTGRVNCGKLNVRANPSSRAAVVNIIDEGMVVDIDPSTLNNKFYRIRATRLNTRPRMDENIKGYCMSKFITVDMPPVEKLPKKKENKE